VWGGGGGESEGERVSDGEPVGKSDFTLLSPPTFSYNFTLGQIELVMFFFTPYTKTSCVIILFNEKVLKEWLAFV
jgi:hypothetical protein